MINKVILIGRITKDPEIRMSSNNLPICRFTLAVNRRGEKDVTDFISCVCFGKTAENLGRFIKKGALIAVDGSINTGSYEKNGQMVYTTTVACNSVQFLDNRSNSSAGTYSSNNNNYNSEQMNNFNQNTNYAQTNNYSTNDEVDLEIADDDLPWY